MKKITKKEHETFVKDVVKIIEDNDFEKSEFLGYQWERETNVGKVYISIWNFSKGDVLYSIFTRFDNPALAKDTWNFLCNPYSGKYNFHFDSDKKAEILESFQFFVHLITN